MRKRTLDTSLDLPTADPTLLVGFHSHALCRLCQTGNCIAKNLATFSRAASSPTSSHAFVSNLALEIFKRKHNALLESMVAGAETRIR
jgi:hypothetical protein